MSAVTAASRITIPSMSRMRLTFLLVIVDTPFVISAREAPEDG
jgi:hypothetical protein